jgi:5,10-methenyltetrahydromethanopterin hydrogenase
MGCLSVRTVDEVIIANKIKNKDNMIIFDEEQKFKLNVHALIKVIESKNNNPEQIKDNIEEVFNNSLKNKQKDINKGEIIQKISEIFISYLSPLSVNNEKKSQKCNKFNI